MVGAEPGPEVVLLSIREQFAQEMRERRLELIGVHRSADQMMNSLNATHVCAYREGKRERARRHDGIRKITTCCTGS